MKLQKVLWATDGSRESEEALKYAILLAEKFNSEILGVYVNARIRNNGLYFRHFNYEQFNRLVEKDEEKYKARFSSIANNLATQGITFKGRVSKGLPSKKIVEFAHRQKADLIVMGTRGHGLLERMLIGSTTHDVLKKSKIPVLAFKNGEKKKKKVEIKNILVPIDIFHQSDSAFIYALGLAINIHADIHSLYVINLGILHIIGTSRYDYEMQKEMLEQSVSHCSKKLEEIIGNIKLEHGIPDSEFNKIDFSVEASFGLSPGISIADYANSRKFDLIVMDTHGRKGIKKHILGSVTERVIQQARCSILAIQT